MNAQSVEALLAEIDKIANNTAFNGVKVLDGSYNSDIRAGNTNPEVINIAIDRMNTDTLAMNHFTSDAAWIHLLSLSTPLLKQICKWQRGRSAFQGRVN